MGKRAGERRTGPKCIAIVGPFASGKTTLLEAILARTGAIPKQNAVSSGSTVGDHAPEAKAHAMSIEASVATTEFMGESLTFIDCPGSIEFAFKADAVLAAAPLPRSPQRAGSSMVARGHAQAKRRLLPDNDRIVV